MAETLDSEKQSLIGEANKEFHPVDRVVVRSRTRRIGLGVAMACCLGVGLSLAIALPLANRDMGVASGDGTPPAQERMMVKGAVQLSKNDDNDTTESESESESSKQPKYHWERPSATWWPDPWWGVSTTATPVDTTTNDDHHNHHHHHHHDDTSDPASSDVDKQTTTIAWSWNKEDHGETPWRPWWWDLISSTKHGQGETTISLRPTTSTGTWSTTTRTTRTMTSTTTTSASWLPQSCPRLPHGNRSRVDVQDVISRPIWYEYIRVETANSPSYVERVSCSTMRLHSTSSNYTDVEVQLVWEEGRWHNREKKSATLYLHREDASSDNWLESTNNSSAEHNQLSLLVQIDEFLLTYECFPDVEGIPNPGYAIRVYATDPHPNYYAKQVADMLLAVSELWGLNPNEESPTIIRQRHCQ